MTNSESTTTFRSQRRSSRVCPDPALVLRFPSGNHGIVLDISPGGLGFLAGAPIEEDDPIRFTISGKSALLNEAAGELVWKDGTGKRAGVRFTHIPAGLQALIGQGQHEGNKASRLWRPTRSIDTLVNEPNRITAKSNSIPAKSNHVAAKSNNVIAESKSATIPERWSRKKFGSAANATAAALALLMAVAIWYPLNRWGVLGSMKALEQSAGRLISSARAYRLRFADVHPAGARIGDPVAFESHESSTQPALQEPIRNSIRARTVHSSGLPRPARPKHRKSHTVRPSSAQHSSQTTQDAAESPELLWQAVEKGSSTAEIELADMYLEARGVVKSCSQAQVLLGAAQRHNSAAAVRKLADLASYGCE